MSWIDGVRHRLRTLFRPAAYDHELNEEMELHLELDAMQQGDQLRAERRFGNLAYYKEEARQMTWLGALDVLRQDLTYVWRTITRSPGLTMTIVATLALGIGVKRPCSQCWTGCISAHPAAWKIRRHFGATGWSVSTPTMASHTPASI